MTAATAAPVRPPAAPWGAMVRAELMKLSKRRGLFWSTLALLVAPVVVGYAVVTIQHAVDPEQFGRPGGVTNFRNMYEFLAQIGVIAAIMAGVTSGGGDLGSGVFRELVVTGRSRIALFAVRFPGGLAFLAPFALTAVLTVSALSIALPSGETEPGAVLMIKYAGWLSLVLIASFALALGVGSLVSGRVAIALLLAWQFIVSPILGATGKFDAVLVGTALERIEPAATSNEISATVAVITIAAWIAVPLLVGGWRTATRDA